MEWRIRDCSRGGVVAEYGMAHQGGCQIRGVLGFTLPAFIVYESCWFESRHRAVAYIRRKGGCYMKLANAKGEMVYFNLVQKNGKLQWVIKGIGDTVVLGRDRQKKKSRTFTQEAQADAYLKRNGFTISLY